MTFEKCQKADWCFWANSIVLAWNVCRFNWSFAMQKKKKVKTKEWSQSEQTWLRRLGVDCLWTARLLFCVGSCLKSSLAGQRSLLVEATKTNENRVQRDGPDYWLGAVIGIYYHRLVECRVTAMLSLQNLFLFVYLYSDVNNEHMFYVSTITVNHPSVENNDYPDYIFSLASSMYIQFSLSFATTFCT